MQAPVQNQFLNMQLKLVGIYIFLEQSSAEMDITIGVIFLHTSEETQCMRTCADEK